eukprot:CAMPEP_0115038498 /NCGR_PEP_ID=MMETSP0216-20121206/43444_1 /TAXON_ID=223996 /ORGANISM="Protocruzia adherens, Strain Boccale" /LENGTH=396 /DNA_ID=CAMNT_0002418909 /DNA_START=198 /DNA_END=1385 /DNA_ORIENTATION=+
MTDIAKPLLPNKAKGADEESTMESVWYDTSKNSAQTYKAAFLFLFSSCLGAGYLSLPYCFKEVGILGGLLILALCIFLNGFAFNSIYTSAFKLDINDYYTPRIIFTVVGTMMAHNLYIVDLVNSALSEFGVLSQPADLDDRFGWFRMWVLCIISVLQFLGTLHGVTPGELSMLAKAMIGCVIYCVVLIVVQTPFYMERYWDSTKVVWFNVTWAWPKYFSVALFAFSAMANTMEAKRHIEGASAKLLTKLSYSVPSAIGALYLPFSICGYLSLLDQTPDVMLSRPSLTTGLDVWIQIARLAEALVLNVANVMIFVGMRKSIELTLHHDYDVKIDQKIFFGINLSLITLILGLSVFFQSIVEDISIIGGIGANLLNWVLAFVVFLKLTRSEGFTLVRL